MGGVSGFLGGLLGIGGGVVIVPALIILLDATQATTPHHTTVVSVATSLACIIFTSASAAVAQARAGMVSWTLVRRLGPFLVLGSFLAGSFAHHIPVVWFRAFIGAFLMFVAVVMLTRWSPSPHRQMPGRGLSAGIGTGGGMVSAIAGIGGGNVIVPTLVYFNTPVHVATATSSTLGVPIAVAGALGYILSGWRTTALGDGYAGYVYLPAFAALVVAAVICAPLGVRTAHRIKAQPLRRAFGVLMLFVSARMFYSAVVT